MVKDFIEKFHSGNCSSTELTLIGICLLLAGVIIGMLFSPVRIFVAGSFNGNSGSIEKPKIQKK
ncbi:MAG: hypothetical protein K5654_01165 [Lachnospiraceae bacterium]|nr:hypothetical protein [Lachnospiraceae bacterium]